MHKRRARLLSDVHKLDVVHVSVESSTDKQASLYRHDVDQPYLSTKDFIKLAT